MNFPSIAGRHLAVAVAIGLLVSACGLGNDNGEVGEDPEAAPAQESSANQDEEGPEETDCEVVESEAQVALDAPEDEWPNYANIVIENPECFDEDLVQRVTFNLSQMEEVLAEQPPEQPTQRISSEMRRCIIDTDDGTITGIVAVTNHSSTPADIEAGLLIHRTADNTRVGQGFSYTTASPGETVELSIIGASSSWPRYVGEPGYKCTHEADLAR